tara:strand:- start:6 stop:134 length:129 start_codon:yes stop_codon:yes gene_type:complete
MDDNDDKEELEAWLNMTPEEKKKFMKEEKGEKYDKVANEFAV